MSHEPAEGKPVTIHASKEGGGAWKWLAGAAVAAVLAGGGYLAWQNSEHGQPNQNMGQNLASNEAQFGQTSQAPIQAGPLPAQQADNSIASPNESGSSSNSAAPSPHRSAAASVPQETIGVTPASTTRSATGNAGTSEIADAQDSEPIIVEGQRRPVWTRTPAAWRLAQTYPTRALEEGREGEASLHCTVLSNGALDCAPVSEYPARSGFSGAAMRVAHMYRHAQTTKDGRDAVGSPVNLRVLFRVDDNTRRG